jgi:hypothetical protein
MSGLESAIPSTQSLASATGRLESAQKTRSSIKFRLKGNPNNFRHLSKSGQFLVIHEALSRTEAPTVTVLFEPTFSWRSLFSKDSYHTVYQMDVSASTVLSYEQAESAWQMNQQIGSWLGRAFLLTGGRANIL